MSATIRVRLESATSCTVHITPSRLARWFGTEDLDYPASRITELGGRHAWVTDDNRPVPREVAKAIEAELTRACVGDRLKELVCE